MKVLMFGWEFPPHISGGLGTACAGLTRALEKAEVDVLFAVPKIHGDESANRTTFINASVIPIRQKKIILNEECHPDSPVYAGIIPRASAFSGKVLQNQTESTRTVVAVSSYLMPYRAVHETGSLALLDWNYAFHAPVDRTLPANIRSRRTPPRNPGTRQVKYIKEPYPFSGTYGPDLLGEVSRYAQAGVEIARRYSFDVIHAHDWMTFPAGMAASKVSGKPLVVHVHATEIDRSGATVDPKVFAIEKEGMHIADKVVTVSNWTKKIAIQHYQVNEDKITVVHNGITPRTDTCIPATPPPLSSPIVTFLGRITHQKGPLHFVEAARKVHETFPDVHFVVVGSGDQLPNMIERIAQLKMSENFHFTGFLSGEEIDRTWAMSNIYVMPSVSEPFGLAPLEAIQAGVPVILSKQAGVSEVMPHAIKVDFWNREALAEAICNLLRFKSLTNTLKKNGAEQIKNLTWDKAAEKLTTLYYELSSKHDRPAKSDDLLSGSPAKKAAYPPVL